MRGVPALVDNQTQQVFLFDFAETFHAQLNSVAVMAAMQTAAATAAAGCATTKPAAGAAHAGAAPGAEMCEVLPLADN